MIRLYNKLPWPRVISDFTLSTWYTSHVRLQLPEAPEIEAWFAHEQPADTWQYERVLAGAKLKFNAPCSGFAFDAEFADRPLASADASLHAAHCEHLVWVRVGLAEPRNFALRVRALVASELRRDRPTARSIARQHQLSRRTLVRASTKKGPASRSSSTSCAASSRSVSSAALSCR